MLCLMAIGGALDRKSPHILQEFIRRSGGEQARLLIIPQASSLADTGEFYRTAFANLGMRQPVEVLTCTERSQADASANIQAVRSADGIFIAGGNQMRLTSLFGGTKLEAELLAAYRRGTVLAGTSAGAAVLSKVMLAFGRSGPTPRQGQAQFTPGFGFTERVIFDQHFRQRDRLGRLIYAVTTHPGLLGVGVDENTAVILEDDNLLTVIGTGAVTILDGRDMRDTNTPEAVDRAAIAVTDLKVHVLTDGCQFNIHRRLAIIPKKILPEA